MAETAQAELGPKIYDIHLDKYRPVTQQDVDKMLAVQRAYGRLREALLAGQDELRAELAKLEACNDRE